MSRKYEEDMERFVRSLNKMIHTMKDTIDIGEFARKLEEEFSQVGSSSEKELCDEEEYDREDYIEFLMKEDISKLHGEEVTVVMDNASYFPFQNSSRIYECVLISTPRGPGDVYVFWHEASDTRFTINANSSAFVGITF